MSLRSRARALLTAAACIVAFGAAAQPAAAKSGPYQVSFLAAFGYSLAISPDVDPPGANDWSCKPTASKPRPVVLVHGTWENRYNNWAFISPHLKAAGHCVFALDFGKTSDGLGKLPSVYGTGDIRASAKQLAAFVDRVRSATGAAKVDIVGHSQGGVMPRQYLKFEGGAGKVANLVGLGATNNGTDVSGFVPLLEKLGLLGDGTALGVAAQQQNRGSEFLATLNAGGHTVPGVTYTTIATKYDEVTTPWQSTFFPAGPGATVKNVTLQDGCPLDFSDHLSMTYAYRSLWFIKKALDPSLRGSAPCLLNPPVV